MAQRTVSMTDAPHDHDAAAPAAPQDSREVASRAAAEAVAALRERLDDALDDALAADACGGVPATDADPAAAARSASAAYVACAQAAGVLSDAAGAALLDPLAARLRTAETTVEARHRAERALEWAVLAARRHAWQAEHDPTVTLSGAAHEPPPANDGGPATL